VYRGHQGKKIPSSLKLYKLRGVRLKFPDTPRATVTHKSCVLHLMLSVPPLPPNIPTSPPTLRSWGLVVVSLSLKLLRERNSLATRTRLYVPRLLSLTCHVHCN
jgi:hypothetical protein